MSGLSSERMIVQLLTVSDWIESGFLSLSQSTMVTQYQPPSTGPLPVFKIIANDSLGTGNPENQVYSNMTEYFRFKTLNTRCWKIWKYVTRYWTTYRKSPTYQALLMVDSIGTIAMVPGERSGITSSSSNDNDTHHRHRRHRRHHRRDHCGHHKWSL